MQVIRDVSARDMYTCRLCGRVTEKGDVDHIKPLKDGGGNEMDNLQWLCKECHSEKTVRESGRRVRPTIGLDGYPVVK